MNCIIPRIGPDRYIKKLIELPVDVFKLEIILYGYYDIAKFFMQYFMDHLPEKSGVGFLWETV